MLVTLALHLPLYKKLKIESVAPHVHLKDIPKGGWNTLCGQLAEKIVYDIIKQNFQEVVLTLLLY